MENFYINDKLYFVLPEEPIRFLKKYEDSKLTIMKPIIIDGYTYWIEEREKNNEYRNNNK